MMLTILGILRNCSFVLFDASKGPLDDNYLVEPSMTAQAALSRPGEPLTKRDIQAHQRVLLVYLGNEFQIFVWVSQTYAC
jgi:hypothetical protein